MINMDLRNELMRVLDPTVPFEANWQTLCSLKERGIKAEEVQVILESMFQETPDERAQERIADLLDCVVGWCAPQHAIWKE